MRKKLFAILMSAMMMVTFMPTMAFAADSYGHTWTKTDGSYKVVEVLQAATCTQAGLERIQCTDSNCEVTKVVTIPTTTVHNATYSYAVMTPQQVADAYVAQATKPNKATAKSAAKTWLAKFKQTSSDTNKSICEWKDVKSCAVCGAVDFDNGDLDDFATTYTDKAVTHVGWGTAKSCDGKATCSKCGVVFECETTGAVHTYAWVIEEATCQHVKRQVSKCTKCGAYENLSTKREDLGTELADHNFGTPVAETEALYQEDVYGDDYATPLHSKGELKEGYYRIQTKAGSTVVSKKYYKYNVETAVEDDNCCSKKNVTLQCQGCKKYVNYKNYSDFEESDLKTAKQANGTYTIAVAHVAKIATEVEPTCKDAGYFTLVCEKCGADMGITNSAKPATGKHAYKILSTTAPTCEQNGMVVVGCETCDTTWTKVNDNVTADWYKDTTTGKFYFTCGKTDVRDMIEVISVNNTEHKYGTEREVIKAATCNEPALKGFRCENCGKLDVHKAIIKDGAALGHNYVEKTINTCAVTGRVIKVCDRCTGEEGSLVVVKEGTSTGKFCKEDCYKVVVDPTIFADGVKALACSVCGTPSYLGDGLYKDTEPVDKLSYAAPKVSVKKGKVVVTVKAQADAVKYVVKAGKKTKTVTAAGKVTLKKVAKKGKKVKVTVTAYNAAGAKVVSKAKSVKAK